MTKPLPAERKQHVRMSPTERKAQLVAAAYSLAAANGIKQVTRIAIAHATDTTDGLVNRYFGNRDGLRKALLDEAVARKDKEVLGYALVEGLELPAGLPRQLERDAKAYARTYEAAPAA